MLHYSPMLLLLADAAARTNGAYSAVALRHHYHQGRIAGTKRGGNIEIDSDSLDAFLRINRPGKGGWRHGVRGTKRAAARRARAA